MLGGFGGVGRAVSYLDVWTRRRFEQRVRYRGTRTSERRRGALFESRSRRRRERCEKVGCWTQKITDTYKPSRQPRLPFNAPKSSLRIDKADRDEASVSPSEPLKRANDERKTGNPEWRSKRLTRQPHAQLKKKNPSTLQRPRLKRCKKAKSKEARIKRRSVATSYWTTQHA